MSYGEVKAEHEAKELYQAVRQQIFCSANNLIAELNAHLLHSGLNHLSIYASNDVDSVAATSMLKSFYSDKLGLKLSIVLVTSYAHFLKVFRLLVPDAVIFLNLGARLNLLRVLSMQKPNADRPDDNGFQNGQSLQDKSRRNMQKAIWCILDYRRPIAASYMTEMLQFIRSRELKSGKETLDVDNHENPTQRDDNRTGDGERVVQRHGGDCASDQGCDAHNGANNGLYERDGPNEKQSESARSSESGSQNTNTKPKSLDKEQGRYTKEDTKEESSFSWYRDQVRCLFVLCEQELAELDARAEGVDQRGLLQVPSWTITKNQRLLAMLNAQGGGEYFSLPISHVLLEALEAHQLESFSSIFATSVATAFHLQNGSLKREQYDESLKVLHRKLIQLSRRAVHEPSPFNYTDEELYFSMFRFCSLQDIFRRSPQFLSSRVGDSGRDLDIDLGTLRLELDVEKSSWTSTVTSDLAAKIQAKAAIALTKHKPDLLDQVDKELRISAMFVNLKVAKIPRVLTSLDVSTLIAHSISDSTVQMEDILTQTFSESVSLLHWLCLKKRNANRLSNFLNRLWARSKLVLIECEKAISRLLSKRSLRSNECVKGLRFRLEGFLGENIPPTITQSVFILRSICKILSRVISGGDLMKSPDILLIAVPSATTAYPATVLGFHEDPSLRHPDRFGFCLGQLLRPVTTLVSQTSLTASVLNIPRNEARRVFASLFPIRKRKLHLKYPDATSASANLAPAKGDVRTQDEKTLPAGAANDENDPSTANGLNVLTGNEATNTQTSGPVSFSRLISEIYSESEWPGTKKRPSKSSDIHNLSESKRKKIVTE